MLIHFIHGYYCIYRPWQPLTHLYFPYCISLIYFSFTKIRMFLYAQIYWLAEFGDVSCLQFNYLRMEPLTPTWEDLVGHLLDNLVGHLSVWSPIKLSVRPECLIVDTLGGICTSKLLFKSHTAIGFYLKIMSAQGSHLGWRSWSPDTILKVYYPRTIHAMFALNWLTGFRREDF